MGVVCASLNSNYLVLYLVSRLGFHRPSIRSDVPNDGVLSFMRVLTHDGHDCMSSSSSTAFSSSFWAKFSTDNFEPWCDLGHRRQYGTVSDRMFVQLGISVGQP